MTVDVFLGVRQPRYSFIARVLHWSVAALVLVQLPLGLAADASADRTRGFELLLIHFQIGVSILALMGLRVLWRLKHGAPPPIEGEPLWRRRAAGGIHLALYGLLLILPASGYVIWVWMDAPMVWLGVVDVPSLFDAPVEDETGRALAWYVHHYSAYVVGALILLHLSVAILHGLKSRGATFRRMI